MHATLAAYFGGVVMRLFCSALFVGWLVGATEVAAAPLNNETSMATYQQQIERSVLTFELYRRLFIKLAEHCNQALAMPDVDIAELNMIMKDKVGISYLQYADSLYTPEQLRQATDQQFSQWTQQYSDCNAIPFKIAYRSAQQQVTHAVDALRVMPVLK